MNLVIAFLRARCGASLARIALAAAALATTAAPAGAAASEPALPTYTATYAAQYKGRDVGTSEFSLQYDAERGLYVFRSHTRAKGLLYRLILPNAIEEHSEFRFEDGAIVPLRYSYRDGTRKGDDDVSIEFDWSRQRAVATGADSTTVMTISDGVLDRASLQTALMRDLESRSGLHEHYSLADDESVTEYDYAVTGTETIETGTGEVEALVLEQSREGSSRITRLWMAPALRFLPIRIEQRRDGEAHTAFLLESVEGL